MRETSRKKSGIQAIGVGISQVKVGESVMEVGKIFVKTVREAGLFEE